MAKYNFQLMGIVSETASRQIECNTNDRVIDMKDKVQKAFRLPPMLKISLMYNGQSLVDRHIFDRIGIDPKKDVVWVIGTTE